MRFKTRSLFWITACIAVAVAVASHWWRSIDGIDGALLSLALGEDTVWATDYTDEAFRTIRAGMTRSEVYALLGPPLEVWDNGPARIYEKWTRSPADTHYRERAIMFQGDKVVEKIGGFYVD